VNQQLVEAWIAQNGGTGAVQYSSEKKRLPNPAYSLTLPDGSANPQYVPGQPSTIEVVSEIWVNSKTGARLHVSRKDDGSFDVIENQGADPNKPAATDPTSPAGRAAAANATTAEQNAAEAIRVRNESQWNADPANKDKPGWSGRYEDHATRDARLDKEKKEADDKARQDKLDEERRAQQNRATPTVQHVKGGDGKEYTRVTTVSADGKTVTVKTYGPDNKEVAEIPGDPTKQAGPVPSGPPMPEIVVGATAQAIRAYGAAVRADPTLTPGQREVLINQFIETAQIATNEAATLQRQQESNLNAGINLATAKQNALQSGMEAAVAFANNLIGKLPGGSPLGGQAYAAMLTMNLLTMQKSGLADITMPGAPGRPQQQPQAAPPTITSPGNPAAVQAQVEAARQAGLAAATSAAQAAQPTTAASSAPRPAGAAPAAPASAAPLPAGRPDQTQVGAQIDNAIMPPSAPAPSVPAPMKQDVTNEPHGTPDTSPIFQPSTTWGVPSVTPTGEPDYGAPGMSVRPDPQMPVNVPYPTSPGLESGAPPMEFPILGQYQQAPQQAAQAPSFDQHPAILRAQVEQTPPWRIQQTDEELLAQGIDPDAIYTIPGRRRIA
jgi:hypothetical protein